MPPGNVIGACPRRSSGRGLGELPANGRAARQHVVLSSRTVWLSSWWREQKCNPGAESPQADDADFELVARATIREDLVAFCSCSPGAGRRRSGELGQRPCTPRTAARSGSRLCAAGSGSRGERARPRGSRAPPWARSAPPCAEGTRRPASGVVPVVPAVEPQRARTRGSRCMVCSLSADWVIFIALRRGR